MLIVDLRHRSRAVLQTRCQLQHQEPLAVGHHVEVSSSLSKIGVTPEQRVLALPNLERAKAAEPEEAA